MHVHVYKLCAVHVFNECNSDTRAGSRDLNKERFLVTPIATPTQIGVVMGMALLFEMSYNVKHNVIHITIILEEKGGCTPPDPPPWIQPWIHMCGVCMCVCFWYGSTVYEYPWYSCNTVSILLYR